MSNMGKLAQGWSLLNWNYGGSLVLTSYRVSAHRWYAESTATLVEFHFKASGEQL